MPESDVTMSIWIGAMGKALVRKGVLAKEDIIAELNDVKSRFKQGANPTSDGLILEINNMISTVEKW